MASHLLPLAEAERQDLRFVASLPARLAALGVYDDLEAANKLSAQQLEVLAAARGLAADGRLVLLTAAAASIAPASLSAADVTILLTTAAAR